MLLLNLFKGCLSDLCLPSTVPRMKSAHIIVIANTELGPYGCIGKPLAMMNLRTTIARLITMFDVTFAPGENCGRFEEQAVDQTLLVFGELNLSFTPRSS